MKITRLAQAGLMLETDKTTVPNAPYLSHSVKVINPNTVVPPDLSGDPAVANLDLPVFWQALFIDKCPRRLYNNPIIRF